MGRFEIKEIPRVFVASSEKDEDHHVETEELRVHVARRAQQSTCESSYTSSVASSEFLSVTSPIPKHPESPIPRTGPHAQALHVGEGKEEAPALQER